MSVRQLTKYMRFRRYSNSFLSSKLREQMDDQRFGWRTINGSTSLDAIVCDTIDGAYV